MTQENAEQLEIQELHIIAESSHAPLADKKHRGGMKEMLSIAVPMMISLSFDSVMTFVDRLFLSRIGSEQMNAAMVGGLASFASATFFFGLIGYSTAMVAQRFGSGRKKETGAVTSHAFIVALFAWPILIGLRPVMHMIFRKSGIDQIQLEPQILYFDMLIFASIIPLLRHSLSSFFSGIGETKIIMKASITGVLVNFTLNYILIFGHFGFPAMGIKGAAIGTIIGGVCSVLILLFEFLKKSRRSIFGTSFRIKFKKNIFKDLIKLGTPMGGEMFLNMIAFQGMIMLFHSRGLAVATASTIMFNWDMVTFVPLMGIETGVTSLVGRYVGAKDIHAIKRSIFSGLRVGWIFTAFVFVAFLIFPDVLVNFFRPDPVDQIFLDSFDLAVFMIKVASIYITIEAFMVVFAGALRGSGDTFWTMGAMAVIHWTLVGILYVLLIKLNLGGETAWLALVIMFMLFPAVLYLRWRSGRWKKAVFDK